MTKKLLLLLAALFAIATGAFAYTETVDGYTWMYQINGDTAEIYNGYSAAISPSPTGAVTIPSTLGGKSVTSIGYDVFYDLRFIPQVWTSAEAKDYATAFPVAEQSKAHGIIVIMR